MFFRQLYTLMKNQDDGVKELKLEQDNRVFNHCFSGTFDVTLLSVFFLNPPVFSPFSLLLCLCRCDSGRLADFKTESEKQA